MTKGQGEGREGKKERKAKGRGDWKKDEGRDEEREVKGEGRGD